jgi:hypothetical protein
MKVLCMAGITKAQFIREYSKKLMEGNAALFIGAGFSQPAGYVNWKEWDRLTA